MTLHLHVNNKGLISCCEYIYYIFWHINHSKTSLQNTVLALLPSCGKGSPHLPTLLNHMFWIEHVVRAGRLQQEKRQKREGMRRQRSRVGGGVSAIAACALKRAKSSGGTPPPVRWTSLPACLLLCSPPPSPTLGFFVPSSSLGPLHYSLACSQSRAHSSSCCFSPSTEPLPPAFTFPPSDPGHGDSELALFCCWDGERASIKLLS